VHRITAGGAEQGKGGSLHPLDALAAPPRAQGVADARALAARRRAVRSGEQIGRSMQKWSKSRSVAGIGDFIRFRPREAPGGSWCRSEPRSDHPPTITPKPAARRAGARRRSAPTGHPHRLHVSHYRRRDPPRTPPLVTAPSEPVLTCRPPNE